jgi:F-type H+-transporting ATPase subunit epsilon
VPLEVHVVTPEREVWSGDANLLVARGVDGEVGIMGGHAPLLVRLAIGPLHVRTDAGDTSAVIDGGFLHVSTDEGKTRADVLADGAQLESEIDVDRERRRASELEERLQDRDTRLAEAEIARRRADLRKALERVNLAG